MIDRFQLGFSNRTLGYRIPEKNREEGEVLRTRLQTLGLLRESGHEHFRGSLVVPVLDEDGNVTEIYGRKITPEPPEGDSASSLLARAAPGRLQRRGAAGLEGDHPLRGADRCADVLVRRLPERDLELRRLRLHRGSPRGVPALRDGAVLIAYDRDEAGEKGAAAVAEQLVPLGIGCFRVQFPHGMDANEYARKVEPAAKSLEVLLRCAAWLGGPAASRARALFFSCCF